MTRDARGGSDGRRWQCVEVCGSRQLGAVWAAGGCSNFGGELLMDLYVYQGLLYTYRVIRIVIHIE